MLTGTDSISALSGFCFSSSIRKLELASISIGGSSSKLTKFIIAQVDIKQIDMKNIANLKQRLPETIYNISEILNKP